MAGTMRGAWEAAGATLGEGVSTEPGDRDGKTDATRAEEGLGTEPDWRQVLGVSAIGLSNHAVERFKERFGSKFDRYETARAQLRARLDDGSVWFSTEQPSWIAVIEKTKMQKPIGDNHVGYLVIDDEIALPLRKGKVRSHPYYAVTCLTRSDVYGQGPRDSMSGKNGGRHRRRY